MSETTGSDGCTAAIEQRSAVELDRILREQDVVLMFITEDAAIHQIEYDEGKLCYVEGGARGYDEPTSRDILHNIAEEDGPKKLVPEDAVREEREGLKNGFYESPTAWAEDTYGVSA